MTVQAQKLLDFSELLEYRVGKYFTLLSSELTVKEFTKEVRGIAET